MLINIIFKEPELGKTGKDIKCRDFTPANQGKTSIPGLGTGNKITKLADLQKRNYLHSSL